MKGYLESRGICIGEKKVSNSLLHVDPESYELRRQNSTNRLNAVPYLARYYGHKLHLDQNEKLAMFGVTHVLAVDGYSSKIVCHCTFPVTLSILIQTKLWFTTFTIFIQYSHSLYT